MHGLSCKCTVLHPFARQICDDLSVFHNPVLRFSLLVFISIFIRNQLCEIPTSWALPWRFEVRPIRSMTSALCSSVT